jgi:excisionase family DNA binding protein
MKELTTTEAAERLGVAQVTVRLWCKQGRFPNARLVEHPRGDYWVIPPGDLRGVEPRKPGPVPKAKPEAGAKKARGRPRKGREAKP